jgi:hypothetical protein
MKTLSGILLLISTPAFADEGIKRTGNIVDVSCTAVSVSQGFARRAAIDDCKKSVAGLLDPTIKVNSKLWTTTKDVYMHEETDSLTTYEGLECQPSNEVTIELNKQVRVSLDCKFDVSKAKALKDQPMVNGEKLNVKIKQEIESETVSVQIASFPVCDTIQIVGGDGVKCSKLTSIVIKNTMQELIVEKAGYMPYRVELTGSSQSIVVILMPL